jgi:hypothetical protein
MDLVLSILLVSECCFKRVQGCLSMMARYEEDHERDQVKVRGIYGLAGESRGNDGSLGLTTGEETGLGRRHTGLRPSDLQLKSPQAIIRSRALSAQAARSVQSTGKSMLFRLVLFCRLIFRGLASGSAFDVFACGRRNPHILSQKPQ